MRAPSGLHDGCRDSSRGAGDRGRGAPLARHHPDAAEEIEGDRLPVGRDGRRDVGALVEMDVHDRGLGPCGDGEGRETGAECNGRWTHANNVWARSARRPLASRPSKRTPLVTDLERDYVSPTPQRSQKMPVAYKVAVLLLLLLPPTIAIRLKGRNGALVAFGTLAALLAGFANMAIQEGYDLQRLPLLGLVSALTTFGVLRRNRGDTVSVEATAEAAQRGIAVEVVQRQFPSFSGGNRKYKLITGTTTKYSVRRDARGELGDWSFLMRTKAEGAQYGDNYLFRASRGDAGPEMKAVLADIARVQTESYLEIEADRSHVSAYWSGEGDGVTSAQFFDWLARLAKF